MDAQISEKFHQLHKNKKILLTFLILSFNIFLLVLAVFYAVGIQNKIKEGKFIGRDIETRKTISFTGKGELYVKPDVGMISFSVLTEKKTVAEAMSENTKKMNAVIASIKGEGVEEKDIKTTNFNISPHYEYYESSEITIWPTPEGKRVLVGYEISQTVQVKVRNLEKIGTIIQKSTDAGANDIGNLQFVIDKEEELKNQVKKEAIKNAKDKAKELSGLLGVNLVRIVDFSENAYVPVYYDSGVAALKEASLPAAPQIESGQNKIEVNVTITYEIN